MGFNVYKIREDFPVLQKEINGKPVIYFDNACMTLKPIQVIDKLNDYYRNYPACGGRSLHKLGKKVDQGVEDSRNLLKKFINAKKVEEIVFSKNTTESINLVMNSLDIRGKIVTTDKEHNSNLIPVQMLCRKKGLKHVIVKCSEDNSFSLEKFKEAIDKDTKLVSIVHTSNLDGTTTPAREIIRIAHEAGALVLLDGAQSVPHKEIDVRKLDADFLAFSGHKMLGPTGTGVLYGKYDLLQEMKPFLVGGDTVVDSTYTDVTFEKPPEKFEAGLQHYAGIIGLGEAARYLMNVGMEGISRHETGLNKLITSKLPGEVQLIGPKEAAMRSGIISFNVKGINPHEIAMMMDETDNVMIRSGGHCVHSWFNAHDLEGSARASLYLYNTKEDCETFLNALQKVIDLVK